MKGDAGPVGVFGDPGPKGEKVIYHSQLVSFHKEKCYCTIFLFFFPQGDIGLQGFTGLEGPWGEVGEQGERGLKGDKGQIGLQVSANQNFTLCICLCNILFSLIFFIICTTVQRFGFRNDALSLSKVIKW